MKNICLFTIIFILNALLACSAEIVFPENTPEAVKNGWENYFKTGNSMDSDKNFATAVNDNPNNFMAAFSHLQIQLQHGLTSEPIHGMLDIIKSAEFSPWLEQMLPDLSAMRVFMSSQMRAEAIEVFRKRLEKKDSSWLEQACLQPVLINLLKDHDKYEDAYSICKSQGFPDTLFTAGPFSNRNDSGVKMSYGPQKSPDNFSIKDKWASHGRDIIWHKLPVPANGKINLSKVFSKGNEAVFYTALFIESPEDNKQVTLAIKQTGASQLWVNGEEIYSDENYCRGTDFLQRLFGINLQKGNNYILLKLAVNHKQDAICSIRVVPLPVSEIGKAGSALKAVSEKNKLKYADPDAFKSVPSAATPKKQKPQNGERWGALGYFSQYANSPQTHPLHVLSLYSLLYNYGFDTNDHKVTRPYMEQLVKSYPDCPLTLYFAAVCQTDENRKRNFLEKAIKLAPSEIYLQALLLRINQRGGFREKVLNDGNEISKYHDSPFVHETLANTYQKMKWSELAYNSYLKAAKGAPSLDRLYRGLEQTTPEEKQKEVILRNSLKYVCGKTNQQALANVLYHEGKFDESQKIYLKLAREYIYDIQLWNSAVKSSIAKNNFPQAIGIMDEALTWMPNSAHLRELLGNILLRNSQKSEALEQFNLSLNLYKENARLREYIGMLMPKTKLFYASAEIPYEKIEGQSLKSSEFPDYDSITLLDQGFVELKANGATSKMYRTVSKVFRQNGIAQVSHLEIPFDKERQQVDVVKAKVHYPDGSISEDTYISEYEYGRNSGSSQMYDSGMVKNITVNQVTVGSIVDIQYTIEDIAPAQYHDEFSDYFFFGGSQPTINMDYRVVYPENLPVAFAQWGVDHQPEKKTEKKDGKSIIYWNVSDIPGIKAEPYMPPYPQVKPSLALSTFKDYNELGLWAWSLFAPQMEMPEDIISEVKKILVGAVTREDKIRAVYKFVTEEIRYVSISFGRFGYTPHKVERTFRSRYGDCKDTAILLCAMLKVAGIESRPALVRTRDMGVSKIDLPRPDSYNHAICYVPPEENGESHYWLDGTTDYFPLGMIPFMDRGTNALVFGPDGGEVIEIDPPQASQNTEINQYSIKINDLENAANLTFSHHSIGEEAILLYRMMENSGQFKENISNYLKMYCPDSKIENIKLNGNANNTSQTSYTVNFKSAGFMQSENGYFKLPQMLSPTDLSGLTPLKERKYPLVFGMPKSMKFITTITLPTEVKIINLPREVNINCSGIKFSRTAKADKITAGPTKILITNTLEFIKTEVSSKQYPQFKKCCDQITASLKEMIIFTLAKEKQDAN